VSLHIMVAECTGEQAPEPDHGQVSEQVLQTCIGPATALAPARSRDRYTERNRSTWSVVQLCTAMSARDLCALAAFTESRCGKVCDAVTDYIRNVPSRGRVVQDLGRVPTETHLTSHRITERQQSEIGSLHRIDIRKCALSTAWIACCWSAPRREKKEMLLETFVGMDVHMRAATETHPRQSLRNQKLWYDEG